MKVYILSVFPLPLEAERASYRPNSSIKIEGAPRGGVSILEIVPQKQSEYVGHGREVPLDITAESFARDLVKAWNMGYAHPGQPEDSSVGIWMETRETPLTEEMALRLPTYREAVRQLSRFANHIIGTARNYHNNPRTRNQIGIVHYAMAKFMGVENELWQIQPNSTPLEQCPYCGERTDMSLPLCRNCKKTVNPERMQAVEADMLRRAVPATIPMPPSTQQAEQQPVAQTS